MYLPIANAHVWRRGRIARSGTRASHGPLPPGVTLTVTADSDLEAVLVSAPSTPGGAVRLPYGYLPVSAPPGYALYYLWAMAGDQRQLALYEDPAHRWIHEQA
jgi:5-deoxy-D-glucuronate isomerase